MEFNLNKQKMIKQVLLVTFFIITVFNLNGQFQKKGLMAGGEINIPITSQYEDGSKHYYFNPKVGYVLLDNFVIGLNIEISLYTLYENRRTELGAGPLVRYYYSMNRVYGFAHLSYLANLVMFNTASTNEYQSKIQPGIGIGYLLSPSVGIDAFFSYDFFKTNDEFTDRQKYNSSSIKIGLQIYFPPKTN
jgi:hypothetical protein